MSALRGLFLSATFFCILISLSASNSSKRSLLNEGVVVEVSPSDTLCWLNGQEQYNETVRCSVDDNDTTIWTLSPGTKHANLAIQLNSSSLVSDISLTFNSSSVIPSSITTTVIGQDGADSIQWKTYFNKTCQPDDNYLRKEGSLYYSCQRNRSGEAWTVSVPQGLFSVANGSDGWFWWRPFQTFDLTIHATDSDYSSSTDSSVIAIADIRLFGWDEPSGACNCHPVGVANNQRPCGSGSTCDCRNSSVPSRRCVPTSVVGEPSYGPISGGTQVTSIGAFLAAAVNVSFPDDNYGTVQGSNDFILVFKTTNGTSLDLNTSLPVRIYWDKPEGSASVIIADWEFFYRPDPVIESISPMSSITRGGIPQTITGENLDSVAHPFITIVVVKGSEVTYINYTVYNALEPGDEFCKHVNSTTLECIAPSVLGIEYEKDNVHLTVSVDINRYNDYTKCEIPTNKPNCKFGLKNEPGITLWGETEVYNVYDGLRTFIIHGSGFQSTASEKDYVASVGGIVVPIVSHLENSIAFYPPDPSAFNSTKDAKDTVLKVGYYSVTVGQLQYYINWIDNPVNRNGLIIGLVCGVGGLAIIILLIILFKTYYKKKPIQMESGTVPRRHDDSRYTRWEPSLVETLPTELRRKVENHLVEFERLHLETDKELGSGFFGKVYRATFEKSDGQLELVAVKTLHDGPELEFKEKEDFLKEATFMADFNHLNVLDLMAIAIQSNIPYVILPLMENGALRDFVANENNTFTVFDLVNFCLQVAQGMEYLAAKKCVHRDLAARNCMVNKDLVVKVADFGLARDIYESDYYRLLDRQRPLPYKWMAVEFFSGCEKYTESTDVWSYGVLMWEVMTRGRKPYSAVDDLDLKRFLVAGRRLEKVPSTPDFVYNLMQRCWSESPDDRPTFKDIAHELATILQYQEVATTEGRASVRPPSIAISEPPVDYHEIELQELNSKKSSYLELLRVSVFPNESSLIPKESSVHPEAVV